jgi:hypothetical protein
MVLTKCIVPRPTMQYASNKGVNEASGRALHLQQLYLLQTYPELPTTVCDCQSGWAGVGCEVAVPSLPLNTPTTLVPVYNPDMKLTWNASLNTAWSLVQLQVGS